MTVYDWAASHTEAQRIEHSFSVAARHERAIRYAEQRLYPSLTIAIDQLGLALTDTDTIVMREALLRIRSVGAMAEHALDQLEGRA